MTTTSQPSSQPGQLIDLHDRGTAEQPKPKLLLNASPFRLMRLVLPAGKEIPQHSAPKEIVVQCVSGRVEFTTMGTTHCLTSGTILYLEPSEPHSLVAIEDSIVLVTMAN
ncbi:MAG: cupin domain-containing protein [Pirellulaceae bacterium]